jgi:hypothetical protein
VGRGNRLLLCCQDSRTDAVTALRALVLRRSAYALLEAEAHTARSGPCVLALPCTALTYLACLHVVTNRAMKAEPCGDIREGVVRNVMDRKNRSQLRTKLPLVLALSGLSAALQVPSPIVVPPSQYLYVYPDASKVYGLY